MIWSISTFREFKRCQRKWFFNEKVGSRSNKDAFRKEIYLLSQLESIDAWRGNIVDFSISEFIIPMINQKKSFNSSEVIDFAKKVARARFDFAKAKRYKEDGLKKTEHEFDYSALYLFEYDDSSEEQGEKFKQAWKDIEISLKNFLSNEEIIERLKSAKYLVKQRNLKFPFNGFTIQGVPDLIAFFSNQPPNIMDWKVHYFGTKSYNEQLMIYALALTQCKPHKDFPSDLEKYSIYDIPLVEYQLLKNVVRNYTVNDDDLEMIKDEIADGIYLMQKKKCDAEYSSLNINDFEKTQNLNNCITCPFKRICLED